MSATNECEKLVDLLVRTDDIPQPDFTGGFAMTTATSTLLGRPVWYELMTSDMAAAENFYKNVIGWTSASFRGAPEPYNVFKRSGDVQVAGLMPTPKGMNMPPFWSMYVAVPKLEEAVAHIKRLGGTALSGVYSGAGPALRLEPTTRLIMENLTRRLFPVSYTHLRAHETDS